MNELHDRDRAAQTKMNRALEATRGWIEANARAVCCDFCCHATGGAGVTFIAARELSEDVEGITADLGAARGGILYSPDWLACDTCAPVVAAGDAAALAAYVVEHADVERIGHTPDRQHLTELYERLYAQGLRRA